MINSKLRSVFMYNNNVYIKRYGFLNIKLCERKKTMGKTDFAKKNKINLVTFLTNSGQWLKI